MLKLVKETKQLDWPIIPSLMNYRRGYPTIAQYKSNPTGYKTIPHGIYTLEFPAEQFRSFMDKDSYVRCVVEGKEMDVKVASRANVWISALASGHLVYNGLTVIATGKFEKQGQVIIFMPMGDK